MSRRPGRPPGHRPDGPEIYRLRVEVHGLSAAELGRKIGYTRAAIGLAERGNPISDVFASRLAKALGVKVTDIATPPGDDIESEPEPKALAS